MNLRAVAGGMVVAYLFWANPSAHDDSTEEIRASYQQFVERVNALSNSITTDVWSPETVGRLKVLESGPSNDFFRAYKVAGASISAGEIDVAFHDWHRAIVIAKREVRLRQKDGTLGEATHDSILALMRGVKKGHWNVAYQVAMTQEEKFERDSPTTSRSQDAARATLDRILQGISNGDRQAVEGAVSTRIGRTLSGEIGRYLIDSKKRETDCEDLKVIACSDQTCMFEGEITSLEKSPGSANSAATGRSALSILVFRRAADESWKLDGELTYGD